MEERIYWNLKKEALDRTGWKPHFEKEGLGSEMK